MLGLVFLNICLFIGGFSGLTWYYRLWGLAIGRFLSVFSLWSRGLGFNSSSLWFMGDGLRLSLVVLTWWISILIVVASQVVKVKSNQYNIFTLYICLLNLILVLTFFCSNVV